MTNCLKCGKPLKLIGKERKNGKGHFKTCWKDNDKNPRTYIKNNRQRCWKEEQKYKDILCIILNLWNITDNDKLDFLLN
jgi:hypothetical protein